MWLKDKAGLFDPPQTYRTQILGKEALGGGWGEGWGDDASGPRSSLGAQPALWFRQNTSLHIPGVIPTAFQNGLPVLWTLITQAPA